ncbi:MAG: nitroreductase family protein [Bryobacteraceae bacterium]|nr:nitroreductase family protein [Solibacteraceae bacterium]MCO5351789.1 nitroreductase family protein [Bryobacteraceae bacterium]
MPASPFLPLHFPRLPEAEMRLRAQAFLESIRSRRSVRHFSPDPIPIDILETAVEAASRAPSGANQQPWRFVLVTDPALKRQIREAAEAEERENYEHRFPDEWLHALEPFGTDWHKEFLETAPCLIAVFRIDYGFENNRKIKHYYVQESVGLACGFLLAALHLAGVATLTHTPSPMGFLARILDRPPNERPFLLIPAGYPADGAVVPNLPKKALQDVLVIR